MEEIIRKNINAVFSEIKNGNNLGEEITVVGASKFVDDSVIRLALKNGLKILGDNKVQEFRDKTSLIDGAEYHFIGRLQTNKVKYIIDKVDMICSLDRVDLAREIDKQARKKGLVMDVLVEINSGKEENKGGVLPENLEAFLDEISHFECLKVRGFMTMGKKCEKNSEYLKYFCETYQLVLDIWQKKGHNVYGLILSMGMSDSFVPAAQAGATMVRIGRRMFNKN